MSGFKDVVGHRDIIQYIQNAMSHNKISHAYILNGQRGSGKKLLANLFAMTLQCESGESEPCMECRSCAQAKEGNQPDIITVKHEKPTTISVDDIRSQLNGDIMIKPYSSRYKIYIIPEADYMTAQAQNALLKTLEEPPEYAVIFLLTENADSLLATIRSRCVILKLRNIKDRLVKKYLMEELHVPDYQAELCAAFAQGNIGRASMLAKSAYFNEIKDDAIQLLKYLDEMDISEIVGAMKQIQKYKLEVIDYLDIITIWYRDVLLYKATKDVEGLVFGDQLKSIKEKATKSSYEGIEIILQSIEKAKMRLKANVNFDLVMELLLLTIKEN